MIFSENDCECSKILWYQFDFKRAIFCRSCNRLCIKHRKSALENFNRKLFKIKQLIFLRLPSVGGSVMYIMPPFSAFQELPDFARFFGKTEFRKNYLSLL